MLTSFGGDFAIGDCSRLIVKIAPIPQLPCTHVFLSVTL